MPGGQRVAGSNPVVPTRRSRAVLNHRAPLLVHLPAVQLSLNGDVLGQRAYPTLTSVPGPIDLVNVFRRSEAVPAVVEEAIVVGARAVWLQEGIVHEDSARRAVAAGLLIVMDRCWLKEHRHRPGS